MTDYLESDGWLHIISGGDTLRAYCEKMKWKLIIKGRIKHYDGGVNLYIPVQKKYVIILAESLWIDTNTKIVNYVKYFTQWVSSGSVNIKFQRTVGGAFELLDGINTTFPMAPKNDIGFIEKRANGDQEVYFVDKLMMEQTGTAS